MDPLRGGRVKALFRQIFERVPPEHRAVFDAAGRDDVELRAGLRVHNDRLEGTMAKLEWCAVILLSVGIPAAAAEKDKGEAPAVMKLKMRAVAPKAAEIDKAATLEALLEKRAESDWSNTKGAVIEGTVVQVEREHDGEVHMALAPAGGETDTKKWMIVEFTPAWQKRNAAFAPAKLGGLVGKKVKATGWLFYEPDAESPDPRGTRWELHPVTALSVLP
jgi:hypothetical protein